MINNNYTLNDTLDNFSFEELSIRSSNTNNNNNNNNNKKHEISFDDSQFFENLSLEFDNCSVKSAENKKIDLENPINIVKDILITSEKDLKNPNDENPKKNIAQTFNETYKLEKKTEINSVSIIITPNNDGKNDEIQEKNLELSSWDLPASVLEKYHSRGIKSMFQWQYECLSNPKVLFDLANLIYSAPTSAGKTLVAEILALKTIFTRKKKVIFILPFVSIVREKMYYFQDILGNSGIRAEGFMGSYNPPGGFNSVHFAICTIEKANSLINKLLEERRLSEIGSVFIDEMHLLGDSHRGYLLELLLTKLRYICIKDREIKIQIIGMSATLPNLNQLAKWLSAELYSTDFRPIPLYEQLGCSGQIYDKKFNLLRTLKPLPEIDGLIRLDTDNILQLCLDTILDSHSVLLFCPTKNWCESLAQQLSTAFHKIGSNSDSNNKLGAKLRAKLTRDLIVEVLEQLKFCPAGLDEILRKTVSFGVGFHHAGLTLDERDIIEGAFRNGAIKVLIATSTLSSGVNLPARKVIIRSPIFCGRSLDLLTYRQMIGRAGRMGKDTEGESILICQKNDLTIAKELISGNLPPVQSCLEHSGKLPRAILEVIASGVALTREDLSIFTNCTLLAITNNKNLTQTIEDTVEFLRKHEFIRSYQIDSADKKAERFCATALGKACLTSSIAPEEGIALFKELEKARQCFVLETELHLIYLITPFSACYSWGQIDWIFYLELWDKLPLAMRKVGQLVGICERFLINGTRGRIDKSKEMMHKRFFIALALQDLVNEIPLQKVCNKFNCNRGMLQSLQQSAATFAGMVTAFSRELGWTSVELLLAQFQNRLQFGVSRDLLDLMRLSSLNGKLARILFKSDIQTLIQLANSHVNQIEMILYRSAPFQSYKAREGETEYEIEQRTNNNNKLKTVWIAGKDGLTEKQAAELLIREARMYLLWEMGLKDAKWNSSQTDDVIIEESVENTQLRVQNKVVASSPIENSSLHELHISDSSLFNENKSSKENLSAEITEDLSSSDNINNKENVIDNDNEEFKSPELFDSLLEKLSITQEIEKGSSSEEYPHQKRNRSILSSSGDSLIESTPTKKKPKTFQLLGTPFIKKYARMSLEENKNCGSNFPHQLDITEINNNQDFFEKFSNELIKEHNVISFSVVWIKCNDNDDDLVKIPEIGANLFGMIRTEERKIAKKFQYNDKNIEGFGFSFDGTKNYYLPLKETDDFEQVLIVLNQIFTISPKKTIRMFDAKEILKILIKIFNNNLEINCKIEDPKIIDWFLDPDGREKNLNKMINSYKDDLQKNSNLCKKLINNNNFWSISNVNLEPKIKAASEVTVVWYLMEILKEKLYVNIPKLNKVQKTGFLTSYELEMKILLSMAKLEINGMSCNKSSLEKLGDLLKEQLNAIEKKSYALAGRRFNFASSSDVSKVIGAYNGKKISTKRKILEQNTHPISNLIIMWRKVNFTLTNTIYPLLRCCNNNNNNNNNNISRIYGIYDTHTSTGRITMHEPSIQMIPKNFQIINPLTKKEVLISCRDAFTVTDSNCLISADYCQLELRILTYLSKDKMLIDIMEKQSVDIFKSIAAKWNSVPEEMVDNIMRSNTKQICYAIIYGMGSATLAEQLQITKNEAECFMETFHSTYSGIRKFSKEIVEFCKINDFIETITGRRRYLPNIKHENDSMRCQAERQAVNTAIQGSAADIVKNAMIIIDEKINRIFKNSRYKPKLILHLHDELIYEVVDKYIDKTVKLIKTGMEQSACSLGKFPVKIKTGTSWGQLIEYPSM